MSSPSRRPRSPPAQPPPALSPLEIEDLLSEILLRLPPQPSSLPRASAVCKRWRGLVTDPRFVRRFRLRHRRNPPVLGFNNVLLLRTGSGIFTVKLESLQFKKFPRISDHKFFLPFASVYTPGIGGRHGGAELLHNA